MGCIEARNGNKLGELIIRVLRLDSDDATNTRRLWLELLRAAAQVNEELFRELIGYPKKLPNLRAAKVDNKRESGLSQSAKELADRGRLPEWY